ncbi:plasmid replication protein RepC [Rhizobium panacihumi]|uniref:plasmid replication protein RepC n=1 Tax=Rhizobium panacihumi TaxID=2008450 RepID=UPI003D790269
MSTPTGFRAMTPGINKAHLLAEQWGAQTAVAKDRALLAFNMTAKLIGVSAQGREIINMIASFTRDCDWEGDSRPLAWPDNQRLMDQTGLSPAALKRNFRALAEAGLIAFKDSPNGRRVGRRNAHTGKIELDRSYGIDLAPLGIRTPELEQVAAEERRRSDHTRNLAHQFTRQRKMLTSILEAATENELPGPWEDCADELATLAYARRGRCDTARLESLCDRIAAVLERANTAYTAAVDRFRNGSTARPAPAEATTGAEGNSFDMNMSPLGSVSEPHIQNTTEKKIHDLYKDERRAANAAQLGLLDAGTAGEEGFGIKPESAEAPAQDGKINAQPIDLTTIKTLCPGFWEWVYAKNGVATWDDVVVAAAGVVRAGMQIPESTWKAAAHLLGRERAAVAVALIFEKNAEGIITTPGAYLNSMVTRAEQGNLHLEPSLFHWRKPRKGRGNPPRTIN